MKEVASPFAYASAIVGLVFGMFGTIEFYNKMEFRSYLIFPTIAIMFAIFFIAAFRLPPCVNNSCKEFRWTRMTTIHYYPTIAERKEMKWFVRSCRDLKIWCGDLFTYEWSTIGSTLGIAVDYTFSLLIGVRKA